MVKKRERQYKSKLEKAFAEKFPEFEYEKDKFSYQLQYKYTPDWKICESLYAETKGYFDAEDRRKHLALRDQHPEIEIIFIFENPDKKIHHKSTTTYGDWCNKHNYRWYDWREIKGREITIEDFTNP